MGFHTKLVKFVDVVSTRAAVRELLTSPYFSMSSHKLLVGIQAYEPCVRTVIDVGANQGQFALAASYRYRGARIYSYEPVPDIYRELERNTRRARSIKAFNCALGSETGELSFFQYQYGHASSALEIHPDNVNPKFVRDGAQQLMVPSYRLDDLRSKLQLDAPVLLKMDVQGFEKEVLIGAQKTLAEVDWIVSEVSFSPLYKRQPLFSELHSYFQELGFDLVAPLDVNLGARSRIIEMDVLYRRRGAA
jgi:FkbM family methyltransferase